MTVISKIRRTVHQQMRRYTIPCPWASIPVLSLALARQRPMAQPMILIASMPRSGSTWVGETLSQSPRAAYLHEPFTQTLRDEGAPGGTFQFPLDAPPSCYPRVAAYLHHGLPKFRQGIVRQPKKWRLSDRHERQMVVKEVNALGLPWFLREFQPHVIHLVRHPAAVSNSRSRLAWNESLQRMFLPETIQQHQAQWIEESGEPWLIAGAVHGLAVRLTSQILADYPNSIEVIYEDLCQDPMTEFKTLLDFCGLPMTDDVRQYIHANTNNEDGGREASPWGTSRDSAAMLERWMHELEPGHIAQIRKGFEAMNPGFYTGDQWWPSVGQASGSRDLQPLALHDE
ncbi:sulfotransferase [Candidatus Entotheonella palauensis]|uniref:sulfotransferase n=1 Tax=Candidatus Entotheonella palauensis TaxID=93172 RepID=UPI0015C48C0D|nr:sulfotransferase [Candidatus Entotheonella palauensis]